MSVSAAPSSLVRIEDLDYDLPPDRIAQVPAPRREDARLLVVDRRSDLLHDSHIHEIGSWLRAGDVLVLNETRVLPARLEVRRPSGGRIELLFIRPEAGPHEEEVWRVLARPARSVRVGERLENGDGSLGLEVIGTGDLGERSVRTSHGRVLETLEREGSVPLPPYIARPPVPEDRERYQTVFARVPGAVAAPTAGLHFTRESLARLEASGVGVERILLHVGPGTFRPIAAADPSRHRMDEEFFEVSGPAAERMTRARAGGGRVVAIGTTVVRALETACDRNGGALGPAAGWTEKFILPPYRFQAVDVLLTNFHLPRTTLLLLVAAFAGEQLLRHAYRHAVESGYRFYSYGDAMLVI